MEEEIWKEVPKYESILWMSNKGKVKSKRKILTPNKSNYLKLGQYNKGGLILPILFSILFPTLKNPFDNYIEDLEGEIWKDINGFNGYQISNLGRVKSLFRPYYHRGYEKYKKSIILTISLNYKGYQEISLGSGKNKQSFRIHRLVAEAFIPNPENKPQVNHIDGNKQNNNVTNLEWCTNSENQIHAINTGLRVKKLQGENNKSSKLTEFQVLEIREKFKNEKISYAEIGREYSVSEATINNIVKNKTWKHI